MPESCSTQLDVCMGGCVTYRCSCFCMQELTQNAIEAEKDFNVKQRLWTEENAILQSRNRSLAEERDRKDQEVSDVKDQLCAPVNLCFCSCLGFRYTVLSSLSCVYMQFASISVTEECCNAAIHSQWSCQHVFSMARGGSGAAFSVLSISPEPRASHQRHLSLHSCPISQCAAGIP